MGDGQIANSVRSNSISKPAERTQAQTKRVSTSDGKEVLFIAPKELDRINRYRNQLTEDEMLDRIWARELLPNCEVSPAFLEKTAQKVKARGVIEDYFSNRNPVLGKALKLMLQGKNWKEITAACGKRRYVLDCRISQHIRGELGEKLVDAGVPRSEWPELFGRAL